MDRRTLRRQIVEEAIEHDVTLVAKLQEYIGELERENVMLNSAMRRVFAYANYQADAAQSRLLRYDIDGTLYDDTYWQQVLDRIRFDLANPHIGEN